MEGANVGIKAVWGFDPDEVAKAQVLSRGASDKGNSAYGIAEEAAARLPLHAESQIYELRRIFRL